MDILNINGIEFGHPASFRSKLGGRHVFLRFCSLYSTLFKRLFKISKTEGELNCIRALQRRWKSAKVELYNQWNHQDLKLYQPTKRLRGIQLRKFDEWQASVLHMCVVLTSGETPEVSGPRSARHMYTARSSCLISTSGAPCAVQFRLCFFFLWIKVVKNSVKKKTFYETIAVVCCSLGLIFCGQQTFLVKCTLIC
jgi:hypothetical protein